VDLLANIDVDDLDSAIEFYRNAFGLRVGRRFLDFAEMLGASSPIYLLAKASGSAASSTMSQQRHYRRHWTPVHLDFVIEDIDSAVERAHLAGAVLEDKVQTHKWGYIAHMADPFGHGFCFIQFLGRGYDEIAQEASAASPPG
jgi:predicted enzyme related to lactoylglutathione lyase